MNYGDLDTNMCNRLMQSNLFTTEKWTQNYLFVVVSAVLIVFGHKFKIFFILVLKVYYGKMDNFFILLREKGHKNY